MPNNTSSGAGFQLSSVVEGYHYFFSCCLCLPVCPPTCRYASWATPKNTTDYYRRRITKELYTTYITLYHETYLRIFSVDKHIAG